MSNDIPLFTYKIDMNWQSIRGSDRPLCSLVQATRRLLDGQKIGGAARGLQGGEILAVVTDAVTSLGIGLDNFKRWVSGLGSEKIGDLQVPGSTAHQYNIVNGINLDPYQKDAVKGLTIAGGVLAMGCGLGKTVTALSACRYLLNQTVTPRVWIACPKIAITTWEELRPWIEANITTDLEIVSIDSLHKYTAIDSHPNSVIIYDEVHLLGTNKARRTKAAHAVRQAFTAGICLTGTLLHGGIEKCLSMLDLAIPGAAEFSNAFNCGKQFHCLYKKQLGKRVVNELGKPPASVMPDFMTWLSKYCQSMNKTSSHVVQHVNLPEQHVHDIEFPWSETIDEAAVAVAQDHYDKTGELLSMQAVAHVLGRSGIELKLAWLKQMATGSSTPVVLFAMYIDTLDAIEALINSMGKTYVRVDGGVTGKERTKCIQNFQDGKVQYFIAQIDAASVSMNLQRAHVSATFDTSWKGSTYDQSLARTCRRGQTEVCHHFNLVANAFQRMVFTRLQKAMDFDASVAEWQQTKAKLDLVGV